MNYKHTRLFPPCSISSILSSRQQLLLYMLIDIYLWTRNFRVIYLFIYLLACFVRKQVLGSYWSIPYYLLVHIIFVPWGLIFLELSRIQISIPLASLFSVLSGVVSCMLFRDTGYTWRLIHTLFTPAIFCMHKLLRVQRFRTCSALPTMLVAIGATATEVRSFTKNGFVKCSHYVFLFRYWHFL